MSVVMLIPTRNRPAEFEKAVRTALGSSDCDVLAYLDDDQEGRYLGTVNLPYRVVRQLKPGTDTFTVEYPNDKEAKRLTIFVGKRIGPAQSINFLCHHARERGGLRNLFPDADIFAHMTDDSIVGPWGWDKYLAKTIAGFKNGIGIISGHHGDNATYVNFAAMSAKTVEAIGWFAQPELTTSYWDTALELIGDATVLVRAGEHEFAFVHSYLPTIDPFVAPGPECLAFAKWCWGPRLQVVQRVREAMA